MPRSQGFFSLKSNFRKSYRLWDLGKRKKIIIKIKKTELVMSKNDGDIIEFLFGWIFEVIGWLIKVIVQFVLYIVGAIFNGIKSLFSNKE